MRRAAAALALIALLARVLLPLVDPPHAGHDHGDGTGWLPHYHIGGDAHHHHHGHHHHHPREPTPTGPRLTQAPHLGAALTVVFTAVDDARHAAATTCTRLTTTASARPPQAPIAPRDPWRLGPRRGPPSLLRTPDDITQLPPTEHSDT